MHSTNSFNVLFCKRFISLCRILVPLSNNHERWYCHPLTFILLIMINEIITQFIIYLVGLLPSEFYHALSQPPNKRDLSAFRLLILRSFGYVILNALFVSLSTFLSSLLYIKWRTKLIMRLHELYFTERRYYHVLNGLQTMTRTSSANDNPDQRITQDVDTLCRTLSNIVPIVLISPFTIGFYTYRTWQTTGYYGPLGISIYFILWTGINKIFISAVSRTIFEQDVLEGNFRFFHTLIRTYHETIAFYNGGTFELTRFNQYFTAVLSPALQRRTIREFLLELSKNLYHYIASILTYLLLALAIFVLHFYDDIPSDQLPTKISETSFIAGYLIFRFNVLNDLADQITLIAAHTHRIEPLIEFLRNLKVTTMNENLQDETLNEDEVLIIKNLSYSNPNNDQQILLRNLSLILHQGQRLLVTGSSGVGKTSFFRVLHFIWPINISGSFRYRIKNAYFLPQRPYFTNRSLHDELSYPETENQSIITDEQRILAMLREWKLSHILKYVQTNIHQCPTQSWQDLLSPGELQRLSLIRFLLRFESNQHPKINLVFLDEITAALDAEFNVLISH